MQAVDNPGSGSVPSETGNGRGFGGTRFEDGQQPGDFQRPRQIRAEMTKLQASAFGFCLALHFDECAEARAVDVIDLLQINDDACGAGCEEIVDHGKQPAALLAERKTPVERQKVDSIHLTLRYFQRHGRLPPPRNCSSTITRIREGIHNSLRIPIAKEIVEAEAKPRLVFVNSA